MMADLIMLHGVRKIVDVRSRKKCRQSWNEELNVCVINKPKNGVGYIINQPDFETYNAGNE